MDDDGFLKMYLACPLKLMSYFYRTHIKLAQLDIDFNTSPLVLMFLTCYVYIQFQKLFALIEPHIDYSRNTSVERKPFLCLLCDLQTILF